MKIDKFVKIDNTISDFLKVVWQNTKFEDIKTINISKPIFAQYEISQSCNQNCFFCYNVWKNNSSKIKSISKSKRIQIINKLIELEIFGLIISGGEPLMVDYLEELIHKLNLAGSITKSV